MSFDTFPSSASFPLPLYLESQPGSFTSQSGNGKGAWSADSRFVVGLYGAIPGARAGGCACGVRDSNGMGCQISKLPEWVGLLLPVGTATEAIVMTTVICQRILKSWIHFSTDLPLKFCQSWPCYSYLVIIQIPLTSLLKRTQSSS